MHYIYLMKERNERQEKRNIGGIKGREEQQLVCMTSRGIKPDDAPGEEVEATFQSYISLGFSLRAGWVQGARTRRVWRGGGGQQGV